MKQIIQDLKKGNTTLEEIPAPIVGKGNVLIKTHRSLVSLGTERMLVEFGKGNLISKARQQPEKVKQVFDKIKSKENRRNFSIFMKRLAMETLMIKVKSEKAAKLIRDLEELEILEVIETAWLRKRPAAASNIADLKKKIRLPMKEHTINEQLEQIRSEWQPDI